MEDKLCVFERRIRVLYYLIMHKQTTDPKLSQEFCVSTNTNTRDIICLSHIAPIYTKREFDGFDVHYFVNTTKEEQKAVISRGGRYMDILTGELQEKDGFTINILGRACDLKRPVKIRMEYNVFAEFVPEELYLVTETPELFKILINGQKIKKTDCGYFADKTFRKLSAGEYFKQGMNSIVLEVDFALPEKNYEDVEKSKFCESELNKLTYYMEIESIYLVGNFDVSAGAVVSKLEKNIVRVSDDFKIIKPSNTVTLKNIEQQGFAFFAGKLVLEKRIEIEDTNKKIVFNKKGINIIKVAVNGKEAGMVLWNPSELDLGKKNRNGAISKRLQVVLI